MRLRSVAMQARGIKHPEFPHITKVLVYIHWSSVQFKGLYFFLMDTKLISIQALVKYLLFLWKQSWFCLRRRSFFHECFALLWLSQFLPTATSESFLETLTPKTSHPFQWPRVTLGNVVVFTQWKTLCLF